MAKFLKSIFNPAEKRKFTHYEGQGAEDKNESALAMDERRKLSISRSGRMKQANKKRHSLSLDLYGDENVQSTERVMTTEYHVNNAVSAPADIPDRRHSSGAITDFDEQLRNSAESKHKKLSACASSPDEEIDSYFEIIDKS